MRQRRGGERVGGRGALAVAGALGLAAAVCGAGRQAEGGASGFYFESTHTLVSKRVGTTTRAHKTWLSEDRLRVDDGDLLTTIVRFDTGEILIASRPKKAFLRQEIKNVGGALMELGETMARHVGSRVTRTRFTKLVGGRPCTQCRFELGRGRRVLVSAWVEEESREAFDAVRALARQAAARMGSPRATLARVLGSLHGMPREVSVGDPERVRLTWTIDRFERKAVASNTFELPADYQENVRLPAAAFTLPEHTYFLGEVTASYFAPSAEHRHRSLLPLGFELTSKTLLRDFYQGREGAHEFGIFRWAKPLTFYLAPELWRYPLSGRALKLLLDIGVCLRGGALKYYPAIQKVKLPAN